MRLLVTAAIFLRCLALRPDSNGHTLHDMGKGGCSIVEGAVKRKSKKAFFWIEKCKCVKDNWVLTEECGDQAGERKFDVTGLWFNKVHNLGRKGSRKVLNEGCKCVEKTESDDSSDDSSKASEPSPTSTKQEKICAATNAIPRRSFLHKDGCKCTKDMKLSHECGDLWLKRKFDPKEVKEECRCITEDEQVRSKVFQMLVGPSKASPATEATPSTEESTKEDDDSDDDGTEKTEIKCKKDPPEPFKFGDIVRIEKKVHTGYWIEFAGVGIGAQYKDAGISGTIAQVVCSEGTKGTEGKVCLRKGRQGARSAGCWDPENLVNLEE